ncbi:MAG: hypothetical protein K2N35_00025 [Muribaculaceae bacterium]|nr:hypothetical protein [Muribaculaceae bacterium]
MHFKVALTATFNFYDKIRVSRITEEISIERHATEGFSSGRGCGLFHLQLLVQENEGGIGGFADRPDKHPQ